jgi:hypothetical protein
VDYKALYEQRRRRVERRSKVLGGVFLPSLIAPPIALNFRKNKGECDKALTEARGYAAQTPPNYKAAWEALRTVETPTAEERLAAAKKAIQAWWS